MTACCFYNENYFYSLCLFASKLPCCIHIYLLYSVYAGDMGDMYVNLVYFTVQDYVLIVCFITCITDKCLLEYGSYY